MLPEAMVTPRQQVVPPELAAYQNAVIAARGTSQLEFPAHVHLETLALCNAACVFCPYPDLDRKGARMSTPLIEKVVRDLQDIPRSHVFQLSPFKVNEPFLDVRLFDLLAMFNEKLPNALITLTTNASPLTEKKLAQLQQVQHLKYLWISVNDYRPAEYEAAMRLPFKRTQERLASIHRAVAEGRLSTMVVLSRVGDRTEHDQRFVEWVRREYPLFYTSVFPRGEWLGQVAGRGAPAPDVGCVRWFELSITATGVVAHCCMDGKAEFPLGDVNHEHVLEIYNKPEYRRLREATDSRLDVEPCRSCGFM